MNIPQRASVVSSFLSSGLFFCPSSPLSQGSSERGALVAVERILQVIEFSAKAPWIIKPVVGEPAQVSRLIQITMCIQTDGSAYVSTRTRFCVKYTRTQTHKYKHTSHYCQALGYAALWEAISHHYLAVWAGSLPHYLLYNQLWLQNNLIPLTGTLRRVVAMPARWPAPGYNFTPLYPTQSGSYVYP